MEPFKPFSKQASESKRRATDDLGVIQGKMDVMDIIITMGGMDVSNDGEKKVWAIK